jgi:N-hydroxyarylamine O-acetyltransferase
MATKMAIKSTTGVRRDLAIATRLPVPLGSPQATDSIVEPSGEAVKRPVSKNRLALFERIRHHEHGRADTMGRPMNETASIDLDAYLSRIEYSGTLAPTFSVLEGLHFAHATHIPFENLDIVLGRPIRLDLASIQGKLVGARRGGYCFEQNRLLAAVLEQLGFSITPLSGRVRLGTTRILPRTHMMLKVDVEGAPWLADVGFGRTGLLHPVPLAGGAESRQGAWSYRVVEQDQLRILQTQDNHTWVDVYAFTLDPQLDVDYEIANYYTSTHPDSRFVQTFTAQRPSLDARYIVRNWEYAVQRESREDSRPITSNEELLQVLREVFGLEFPAGTRFPQRSSAP